jgi:release factor glutamine methyltransferase
MLSADAGVTVADALRDAAGRLAAAGLEDARREARLLVATALDADLAAVVGYPERRLGAAQSHRLAALVERRAAREPAARLLGRREFWSLDFAVSPETLVPRPDSEAVVDAVLAALPQRRAPLRILDFGTGTGCLLLALLSEYPAAVGVGVDIAAGAAVTARTNACALGFGSRASFLVGSWGDAIAGGFDVIVANPPYIPSGAIGELAPEVALYEPRAALDGGDDGFAAYRALLPQAGRLLRPGSVAVFEIGAGQGEMVSAIATASGLAVSAIRHDLAGIARCIVAGKPATEMSQPSGTAVKKTIGMPSVPV